MIDQALVDRSRRVDIIYRKGDSFDLVIPVINNDGTDFDFTGFSAQLIVTSKIFNQQALLFEDGAGLTLELGKITLTKAFDDTQLIRLRTGDYIYFFIVTNPDTKKQTWLNGKFMINENTYNGISVITDPVLIRLEITADSYLSAGKVPFVDCGDYDASTNLFPEVGGTGLLGVPNRGNIFYITVAGILGGQYMPVGSTIRARINSPGQILNNWIPTF